MNYSFTEAEAERAHAEWGCNCGPSSLAFALQMKLDDVRHAIPDFERKRYTSPTMMKMALANLGQNYRIVPPESFTPGSKVDVAPMFAPEPSLVRVQWCGPWTQPGMNPKWAYGYTHWIATWQQIGVSLVFDCNGGACRVESWIRNIVPLLTRFPRATGEWFPTHIWRLNRKAVTR